MKFWVIGALALIVVGAGFYFISSSAKTEAQPEDVNHDESTETAAHAEDGDHTNLPPGMSMEEHMKLMDDGQTVMAMIGELNPKVLFVTPGQELAFASHENFDVQLKTKDGEHMTVLAKPGSEHTTFTAPMKPGRYEYYSSHDPNVFVTIVVEE